MRERALRWVWRVALRVKGSGASDVVCIERKWFWTTDGRVHGRLFCTAGVGHLARDPTLVRMMSISTYCPRLSLNRVARVSLLILKIFSKWAASILQSLTLVMECWVCYLSWLSFSSDLGSAARGTYGAFIAIGSSAGRGLRAFHLVAFWSDIFLNAVVQLFNYCVKQPLLQCFCERWAIYTSSGVCLLLLFFSRLQTGF